MINLNTFQTIILKFYILPILIVGFIFSYNTTYTISKFFVDDSITINKSTKEIKEIQRRNILLNGVELKKWTTLTQTQKEYFLNNEKEKLEDKTKFKLKFENITTQEKLIDNMDNYNFFYFLKVLLNNFKFGIILLFCIPFYFLYVFYKKYYLVKLKPLEKFYNLPFFMSSLNSVNNIQNNNKLENIKNMDKFIKYDEKEKLYLFKTNSINQKKIYENRMEDIENYLNLTNLKITQENLIIKISEKKIKKIVEFDKNDYKDGKLYLGEGENNKKIYLNLSDLQHTIIVGQSGSGKSVFLQNLLVSIFKNINFYEKIYLVDFKMVEMARYEDKHPKIEVIDDIEVCINIIKEIHNKMRNRLKEMKLSGEQNYSGNRILVFFDEFRTLKNNRLDTKEQKILTKILIDIIQKSRRRGIYLIFRGQKRDTNNMDSGIISNIMNKILLKTSNNDNITKVAGNSEELEANGINLNEIKNFNRGRLFYKDELNGDKYLIQSPFFDLQNKEHKEFMFSFLEKDKKLNEIKEEKEINFIKEEIEEIEEKIEEEIEEENDNLERKKEENNILEFFEEKRKKLWEEIKTIENKEELTEKRKILMLIKKKINNNEIEEIKELFKNF